MPNMRSIAFNLSNDDLHKLSVLAKSKEVAVGEEIRLAIQNHLENNKEKLGPALVKDDQMLEAFIKATTESRPAKVIVIKS